jgi:nuclear transport factor 2 (NTF2) superfamily protein
VAQGYTVDSDWRDRHRFFKGREAIVEFLRDKWQREQDYKLMKELWCSADTHLRAGSSTSGTMTRDSGIEHTATSTGSSTPTGSCAGAT